MKTILIIVAVVFCVCSALLCWSCCRVAGLADEQMEQEYAEFIKARKERESVTEEDRL